ncbi:MAG: hypothetical protein ABMA15_18225 [Vicinamibacterales bacterium]
MDDTIQPPQTPVMRLIFEYEGDQVRLVSQTPVNLSITGFDLARTQRPGYYIDTRDAAGQTLARVPARNLFSTSAEVFPEQPGDLISRVEVATPRGAFTVVVPAGNGADSVSVVRVAPGVADIAPDGATSATTATVTTTDIATFALQISR